MTTTARIILTGATGGIGRAIAQALAAQGAALLLVGRRADALEDLRRELARSDDSVTCVCADLTTGEGREAIATAARQFSANTLINNAGVNTFALLEGQSEADIERQLNTNLIAPMLLTRRILPLLASEADAYVLNIGSAFGSIGFAGFAPYCASKFGLRGFSEALRRELADSTIRVGYLAPRSTHTALNSRQVVAMNAELGNAVDAPAVVADAVVRMVKKREALRHIGQPERFFARLNAVLPSLVDNALKAKLPIIRRHAEHRE